MIFSRGRERERTKNKHFSDDLHPDTAYVEYIFYIWYIVHSHTYIIEYDFRWRPFEFFVRFSIDVDNPLQYDIQMEMTI